MYNVEHLIGLNSEIVMRCTSLCASESLFKILHNCKFKWVTGAPLLNSNTFWCINQKDTCYYIYKNNNGACYVEYSSADFYKNEGMKIIDFSIQRTKHLAKQHLDNV